MISATELGPTIDGKLPVGRWFREQRAAHDAIMVGAGTMRSDNPELTVRNALGRNALRVIEKATLWRGHHHPRTSGPS